MSLCLGVCLCVQMLFFIFIFLLRPLHSHSPDTFLLYTWTHCSNGWWKIAISKYFMQYNTLILSMGMWIIPSVFVQINIAPSFNQINYFVSFSSMFNFDVDLFFLNIILSKIPWFSEFLFSIEFTDDKSTPKNNFRITSISTHAHIWINGTFKITLTKRVINCFHVYLWLRIVLSLVNSQKKFRVTYLNVTKKCRERAKKN